MSSVRQRKKTDPSPSAAADDAGDEKGAAAAATKKPHVPSYKDWIPIFALAGVAAAVLLGSYSRYGPTVVFGQGWRDLRMTSEQWQTHLTSHTGDAAGRKLVFIGGPHRGGTTYIWHGAFTFCYSLKISRSHHLEKENNNDCGPSLPAVQKYMDPTPKWTTHDARFIRITQARTCLRSSTCSRCEDDEATPTSKCQCPMRGFNLNPRDETQFKVETSKSCARSRRRVPRVGRNFKLHPEVSGFGSAFETGSDNSEGIFMQDVYTKMGIGIEFMEFMKPETARSGVRKTGLGRYALAPESDVHWTESHPKVTEYSQTRVLNRFGGYWNMSKRVLVEKSPPNAVLSRFFQATYNIGNKGPWTNTPSDGFGGGTSVARFVFVSRHPIANALAQQALEEVKFIHVQELVENWVQLHEYMKGDAAKLQFIEWVTLEGFVENQPQELARLWKMAGLGDDDAALTATAAELVAASGETPKADFNKKYRDVWCGAVAERESARAAAAAIVDRFGARVAALGLPYNLDWCKGWSVAA